MVLLRLRMSLGKFAGPNRLTFCRLQTEERVWCGREKGKDPVRLQFSHPANLVHAVDVIEVEACMCLFAVRLQTPLDCAFLAFYWALCGLDLHGPLIFCLFVCFLPLMHAIGRTRDYLMIQTRN